MRALVLTKYGPPEVLRIEDRPTPSPQAGEVLVRVYASGVNFADLHARVGLYPDAPKPPSIVGYEVSGIVESVGEGTDKSLVGTRVMAPTRFGGYARLRDRQGARSRADARHDELRRRRGDPRRRRDRLRGDRQTGAIEEG